jgi:hypothetical protein
MLQAAGEVGAYDVAEAVVLAAPASLHMNVNKDFVPNLVRKLGAAKARPVPAEVLLRLLQLEKDVRGANSHASVYQVGRLEWSWSGACLSGLPHAPHALVVCGSSVSACCGRATQCTGPPSTVSCTGPWQRLLWLTLIVRPPVACLPQHCWLHCATLGSTFCCSLSPLVT